MEVQLINGSINLENAVDHVNQTGQEQIGVITEVTEVVAMVAVKDTNLISIEQIAATTERIAIVEMGLVRATNPTNTESRPGCSCASLKRLIVREVKIHRLTGVPRTRKRAAMTKFLS